MPFVGGMHRRSTLSGSIREGEVNPNGPPPPVVGADPPLAARSDLSHRANLQHRFSSISSPARRGGHNGRAALSYNDATTCDSPHAKWSAIGALSMLQLSKTSPPASFHCLIPLSPSARRGGARRTRHAVIRRREHTRLTTGQGRICHRRKSRGSRALP